MDVLEQPNPDRYPGQRVLHGGLIQHSHSSAIPTDVPPGQSTKLNTVQGGVMADTLYQSRANCLGQSCLRWDANGELSPEDRRLVLERLLRADGCTSASAECWAIHEPAGPVEPFER